MTNSARAGTTTLLLPLLAVLAWLGNPADARAQPSAASTVAIGRAAPGDCTVTLSVKNPRPGDAVGLVVDLAEFQEKTVSAGTSTLSFEVGSPLRPGSEVRARVNGTQVAAVTVGAASSGRPPDSCPEPAVVVAERSPLEAIAYFGEVIDTFAPDSVGGYKNPAAGSAQKLRTIFGIDFDYRAVGDEDSRVQFWLKGETLHGVRTADIDCSAAEADRPPVCSNTTPFPDRARYILEHASSLEAFFSPRVEFLTFQKGTAAPARLYATLRFGFIALEQAPSVFKSFHVGLGLRVSDGPFEGSYLEGGVGRNELFSSTKRMKMDALLSFSLDAVPLLGEAPRFFVEMVIDNDLGHGADSVQTLFGIDVDLKKAFQP